MHRMAAMIIVTGVIALAALAAIAANLGPEETVIASRTSGERAVTVDAPFAQVEKTYGATRVKAPFVDVTVPEDGEKD